MIDIPTCFTYAYSAGTVADFKQSITGDAASTNIIDLDANGIKISGGSRPPWLICRVVDAFVTLTSLEILLQTDSDSGFATTPKDVAMGHFLLASMTAGAVLINQPLGHWDYQQYMRLYFNVVGSDPGSGSSLVAYLSDGPESAETDLDNVNL